MKIYMAYSRRKTGFTVYTYEKYTTDRVGYGKGGFHITSDVTLTLATDRAKGKIRDDWQYRDVDHEIINVGRISDIRGRHWNF